MLVEQYWDDYRLLNPRPMPQGAAVRFDSGSGLDISAQFLADSLSLERRYLADVSALPRERLTAAAQLTYDLFKRDRELAVESFTYPAELSPVNPYRSVPLEFARTGTGTGAYAILSAKDLDNWQLRVEDYVHWTGEAIVNMREGLRRGYAEPRVLVAEMLPVLGALAEDIALEPVLTALCARYPTPLPSPSASASREPSSPASGARSFRPTGRCAIFCATSICRERARASACRLCRSASPGMPSWFDARPRRV